MIQPIQLDLKGILIRWPMILTMSLTLSEMACGLIPYLTKKIKRREDQLSDYLAAYRFKRKTSAFDVLINLLKETFKDNADVAAAVAGIDNDEESDEMAIGQATQEVNLDRTLNLAYFFSKL